MTVKALALLPLLLALTVTDVPQENVDASVLDITCTVESLQTESTEGLRTTITISSDVLFAFDRADLTPTATRHLTRLARRLRAASGTVRVDGYTDALGSAAYNLALSRRRARSVAQALDRVLAGSPPTAAVGHGEADPVAPNVRAGRDNPPGRAKNRRVTILF